METALDQQLTAWVKEARGGDTASYGRLLAEVAKVLRPYFERRARRQELVEDLVQETLISVHRYMPTYDINRLFGPWLYAIAEHRLIDSMRKLRRIESNEVSQETSGWDCALENTGDGRDVLDVEAALSLLNPKQRQVIEMLKVKDMTAKEVATATGLSVSDVKVTAFRGYEALRRYYGVKREDR